MDSIKVMLFQNRPPENAVVEDIERYLTPSLFYPAFADNRRITFGLNLTDFKVSMFEEHAIQANFPSAHGLLGEKKPTYMTIQAQTGGDFLCYFIEKFERVSNTVARITAKMDVLNTYFRKKGEYLETPAVWSAISIKSRISRRMVDRFKKDTSQSNLIAKIDPIPENVNPSLYMKGEPTEFKGVDLPPSAVVGNEPDEWVLLACSLNGDGKSPTILLLPRYNNIKVDGTTGMASSYIKATVSTDSGLSYANQKLVSFNDIDLTSQRIIAVYSIPTLPDSWNDIVYGLNAYSQDKKWKAVAIPPDSYLLFPYGGLELPGVGFAIAANFDGTAIFNVGEENQSFGVVVHNQLLKGITSNLVVKNGDVSLSDAFRPSSTFSRSSEDARKVTDPKLFNSEFTQYRFIYDSTSITIPLEHFEADTSIPRFELEAVYSTGFSGQFYFTVDITGADRLYRTSPFDNVLQVGRSNKEAFYSSEYWNYMRNGYNYDVKAKSMQDVSSWLSVAGQILTTLIGAGVGIATANPFAIASAVGSGVSLVNSLSSAAIGTIQRQDSIDRKIDTAKATGVQVKDISANDLFRSYQGSLFPIMCKFEPRDDIKKLVDDLFYYYGYSRAETLGALEDSFETFRATEMASRYWFDYIEMGIEWKPEAYYLDKDILNEISTRFSTGFTIFHHGSAGSTMEWDFEQVKENWEVWALEKEN